jgi:DinB family protein
MTNISRPQPDEIPDFFKGYVGHIPSNLDGLTALERQKADLQELGRIGASQADHRYAEGKWSVKEVIGHMTDTERILAYRLLRIARGDRTPLPAFDESEYAQRSNAGHRSIADLAAEIATVRESTLSLVRSLEEVMLDNRGIVRAGEVTCRAQVFIIAGHFEHHLKALRERYRVLGA